MKLLAGCVVAIGCGSSPPPPAPVASTPSPCRATIDQLVARATTLGIEAGSPIAAGDRGRLRQLADKVVERCVADRWSDATLKCGRDADSIQAMQACLATLTPDQLTALQALAPPERKADPSEFATTIAKTYAFEAYPQWAVAHPDTACPATIAELRAYTEIPDELDPWGHPYKLMCGATLPAGAKGVAIQSAGPDGQFDTADDVRSWE